MNPSERRRKPYAEGEREFLCRRIASWRTAADRRDTLIAWLQLYHNKTWFEFSGYLDSSVLIREVRKHHPALIKDYDSKTATLYRNTMFSKGYGGRGEGANGGA